jgi:DNA-directed RNA polymerase I subunit RPA1
VYNPLTFPTLFKLLRTKCFACHRFKAHKAKSRKFEVKLKLLAAGLLGAALEFDDKLLANNGVEEEEPGQVEERMERVMDEYEDMAKAATGGCITSHIRMSQRKLISSFLSLNPNKCENCGAVSPSLKKDGYTKIFQCALSAKSARIMAAKNMKIEAALSTLVEGGDVKMDTDDSDNEPEEPEGDRSTAMKYLNAMEVQEQVKLLFARESKLLSQIWHNRSSNALPKDGWQQFFVQTLPVIPPRFRPPAVMGTMTFEHPLTVYLQKILQLNESIVAWKDVSQGTYAQQQAKAKKARKGKKKGAAAASASDSDEESENSEDEATAAAKEHLQQRLAMWVELQATVNCLFDSSKASGAGEMPAGIRQVLEKKEGLFRKHMMGKRVNSCARSVISPDPYIATTEIGVPKKFAMELTYAQPVTNWNVDQMRKLVMNGPDVHPGANYVEDENGVKIDLKKRNAEQREAISKTLLTNQAQTGDITGGVMRVGQGKKVWRHLVSGDALLVNRQPTLHKPGIMSHIARVLATDTGRGAQQTIRMHYANCNTYNADFDGDEINLHFPQDERARAESYLIAANSEQYLVPTTGEPLRGLIQDHVDAGTKLCNKDSFFNREQFQQLVFAAVSAAGLGGQELGNSKMGFDIQTIHPAVLKPQVLWTGKQVVSSLLIHLARTQGDLPLLNLDAKCKIPNTCFGKTSDEHMVVVRDGELLQGVLDKGQIGSTEFGLVHAVYELYGATACAYLLNALGRLLTAYMQSAGHSCGIEDLTLTRAAEEERFELKKAATLKGLQTAAKFVKKSWGDKLKMDGSFQAVCAALGEKLVRGHDLDQQQMMGLDAAMSGAMNEASSAIVKCCLPNGQTRQFPKNCFALMTNTGAKGSIVNHSQISCALGQQALEGRRVPVTAAGRSLPCFAPYDPRPRAGGFVVDRFLTGVRPAEYYFHCMAGREGLVDTAVKTSRSGYLQRCLVKHLEELNVGYDRTVRDAEGNMVQVLYGEDGMNPSKGGYLAGKDKELTFIARNHKALVRKHGLHAKFLQNTGLEVNSASRIQRQLKQFMDHDEKNKGKKAMNGGQLPVGCMVQARRQRGNKQGKVMKWKGKLKPLELGWHAAEVLEVVHADGSDGESSEGAMCYKIKYVSDDAKAVLPRTLSVKGSKTGGEGSGKKWRCMNATAVLLRYELPDPTQSQLFPEGGQALGTVGEKFQAEIDSYCERNPDGVVRADAKKDTPGTVSAKALQVLLWLKYMRDMVEPGENVGTIAAQSVGEPSTQMTLNTFHLAGHGGANVTLGIPRLREVIMTASKNIKTPSMTIPLKKGRTHAQAKAAARSLGRLPLSTLLRSGAGGGVTVSTRLQKRHGSWFQYYSVDLTFMDQDLIKTAHGIKGPGLARAVTHKMLPKLLQLIRQLQRKMGEKTEAGVSKGDFDADDEGEAQAQTPSKKKKGKKKGDDEDNDEAQGTLRFGEKAEIQGYGEMDDEEKAMAKVSSSDSGSGSGSSSDDSSSDDSDDDDDESPSLQEGSLPWEVPQR